MALMQTLHHHRVVPPPSLGESAQYLILIFNIIKIKIKSKISIRYPSDTLPAFPAWVNRLFGDKYSTYFQIKMDECGW